MNDVDDCIAHATNSLITGIASEQAATTALLNSTIPAHLAIYLAAKLGGRALAIPLI